MHNHILYRYFKYQLMFELSPQFSDISSNTMSLQCSYWPIRCNRGTMDSRWMSCVKESTISVLFRLGMTSKDTAPVIWWQMDSFHYIFHTTAPCCLHKESQQVPWLWPCDQISLPDWYPSKYSTCIFANPKPKKVVTLCKIWIKTKDSYFQPIFNWIQHKNKIIYVQND